MRKENKYEPKKKQKTQKTDLKLSKQKLKLPPRRKYHSLKKKLLKTPDRRNRPRKNPRRNCASLKSSRLRK